MKKKNIYSMKLAYLVTSIIVVLMLLIQLFIVSINHVREARVTTNAYMSQVKTILEKNERQEAALLSSSKEDSLILAKATAYYLDNSPDTVSNVEELRNLCSLMSIDELNIFDETGTITSGSEPQNFGLSFDSNKQMAAFKPMLTKGYTSMYQNLSRGALKEKSMVYAITWNTDKTRMVQVGIEPVRIIEELNSNDISNVVNNIVMGEHMSILVADVQEGTVIGSTVPTCLGGNLQELCSVDLDSIQGHLFTSGAHLKDQKGPYYCTIDKTSKYYLCVFLSHKYFLLRSLESFFIVTLYLLLASIVINIIIHRLLRTRQKNYEYMQVFASMSEIYYSLHLMDLSRNTFSEYSANTQVANSYDKEKDTAADKALEKMLLATMTEQSLDQAKEFCDLATLPQRMKDKKIISRELVGKTVGWIRMSFITITAQEGVPQKVIMASQIIDEEKKMAQSLYEKSHIDELTKCFNRRAFNNDILTYMDRTGSVPFAFLSLDLNGLKTVNDQLGHEAGDELLRGAVECMNETFSTYGKIYRIGGDEFVSLLFVDEELIQILCKEFERKLSSWHGRLVPSVSVSYGYVLSTEAEGKSMIEISNLADKRMYAQKDQYYKEKGLVQRRT